MLSRLKRKYAGITFEKQLFLSFFALSAFLLFLAFSIMLYIDIDRKKQEIDTSISEIASYTANMSSVIDMLEQGYPSKIADRELDLVCAKFSYLSVLDIYDIYGLRFYHTDRRQSGETVLSGEERPILEGSDPYITSGIGSGGIQRRAFHAVHNQKDEVIGFVTVSVFTNYISEQVKMLAGVYIAILLLMVMASGFLVNITLRMLQRSLHGHHPKELLELYVKQDTVLNAMSEGILASDLTGSIIFANDSAKTLLMEAGELIGRSILEVIPESKVDHVIREGKAEMNRGIQKGKNSLVFHEVPIGNKPYVQGVLTILNDRSEIEALSDELSGAQSMLDTLRSFNHEFLNKLHVILGYLQIGEIDKAIAFIINSNLVSSQAIRQTADCIRVTQICALVIGKMMHAAELGIVLRVSPDSRCKNRDLLMPLDSYVLIIGNLLENAIEELVSSGKDEKEITLGLYLTEEGSLITCEDTGRGVHKDILPAIFEKGVSSKGEGRGTGLNLVSQIVKKHGGEINIDTETDEGSIITVSIERKEPKHV